MMPKSHVPEEEIDRIKEIALGVHEDVEKMGIVLPDPFNLATEVSNRLAREGIPHERIMAYWTGERPPMEFGKIDQMIIRFPQWGGAILDPSADLWNEYEEEQHPAIWFPADPDHYDWEDTNIIKVKPGKRLTSMFIDLGGGATIPILRRRPVAVRGYRRRS